MGTIRVYFESMAGTHLLDAIDALRDSGSSDALYGDQIRSVPASARSFEDAVLAEQEAEGRRMAYSRHALLFAAFAAEAYINDFLYAHVEDEKDRGALVMMSTLDKYIVLPKLLDGEALFSRGRAPWSKLKWLFRRRDELVHAKPLDRLQLVGEDPDVHNPDEAAKAIAAVAESGVHLESATSSVAATIHRERDALLSFGRLSAAELPAVDGPPAPFDLYADLRGRRRGREP